MHATIPQITASIVRARVTGRRGEGTNRDDCILRYFRYDQQGNGMDVGTVEQVDGKPKVGFTEF